MGGYRDAWLSAPVDIALAPFTRDFYIADYQNGRLRFFNRTANRVSTVAGGNETGLAAFNFRKLDTLAS